MKTYRLITTVTALWLTTMSAFAHHGWRWTSETDIEVTGTIESTTLGNPHGILILDVDGEKWTAEVGQPWRNQRAGLTDEMFKVGNDITVEGQRSSDANEKRVKAESVIINGKSYILYPDRD